MSNFRKIMNLYKVMNQQWLSIEELQRIQNKMLRKMIKHAYDKVPFYHEKFRTAGLRPEDIKTIDDLVKIPITTKIDIKNNADRVIANGVNITKCDVSITSGSTGIPLKVYYSEYDDDYEKAIALRPNLSCGQKIWDKWVVITSPEHIVKKKWFQKFGFFSPSYLSLFSDTREQLSILERIKPRILDGYASSLFLLAQEVKKSDQFTSRPEIIFSTSEILDEKTRSYIRSVFDAEVYDQFGCVELARTAWECPAHSGYHIDMDAVVMEFLHDGEPVTAGERGEIVYTGLYNYAMPFIRYAIEDIGIPSDKKCSCGRGLPLMSVIEGRKDAYIQIPNGKIFSPIIWTILLRKYQDILKFKVVQETRNLVKIFIVTSSNYQPIHTEKIISEVKQLLGQDIFVEVYVVDTIPRDPSGKVRSVTSKIKIDWSKTMAD